ncbi:beta-lactamase/transpeptidase-like protein [Hypoxylon sp. NC1633]|nr:beta-lactamase/transpeptidase-like protein [Hypoxylon sp. NC1633]
MEVSSVTKLPTSIAALRLVENGYVTLDEDVSHLIPSFAKQGILTSVADDGAPSVHARQNPITLRRLAAHSSGAGYIFLDEKFGKVQAPQYELPLLFESGEGWAYGMGID